MRCKAKKLNGGKCSHVGTIKGYCIAHYAKYNYNKVQLKNLERWRKSREKMESY